MCPAHDGETDPLESLAGDPAPGPDRQAQGRQALARLETALRALPDRQREAFTLRIWQDTDVAGTARAMDVSEGSVKTHCCRPAGTHHAVVARVSSALAGAAAAALLIALHGDH